MSARDKANRVLIHVILILVSITMLVPFLWMILTAFKTMTEATSVNPFVILPSTWRWDSFKEVIENMDFLHLYINTLLLILGRVVCAVLTATLAGYAFGLLQTSYIYGRMKGIDIREHGSGNAGTTNALRVLGKKAGLIVFIGDLFKAIIISAIVLVVIGHLYLFVLFLFFAYAGLGTVLGHNFPCYLHFKGGKGIATTAGIIVGFLDPVIIVSCLIAFIVIVAITRYVSLGSITIVTMFCIEYAIFAFHGKYGLDLASAPSYHAMVESVIVVAVICGMAIVRHHANIVRLLHHEENKLGATKAVS